MEMNLTINATNKHVFMNKQLEKVTQTIMECDSGIHSRQFAIAGLLARVESEKLYKDDGFANAAEYATATFGIKKSLAYGLISIGTDYTRPILNAKGKVVGYCSNLLPPANPDAQDAPLSDFTTTQIARFMSLGREKVLDLVKSDSLKPSMTVREILDVVKANKEQRIESTFAESQPETPDNAEKQPTTPVESVNINDIEQIHNLVAEPRNVTDFDNIPTDWLIAELRMRGFTVIKDGKDYAIDWKPEE